jgi:gliding motility-associated-like protein
MLILGQGKTQTLVGNAIQQANGTFRLTANGPTQIGAVWMDDLVAIDESWEMRAEVFLGQSDGGADGMVFVLRNESSEDIGLAGANMGFGGIGESVGVEMDTYYGSGLPSTGDVNLDHLGIQKNGSVSHFGANSIAGPVAALPGGNTNIETGGFYDLRVTYDASTNEMVVYFNCNQRLIGTIDIEDALNESQAVWGFTAATGGATNAHRVRNLEWFARPEGLAPDLVTACAGQPAELSISNEASNPTWSPSAGLSEVSGYSIEATVDSDEVYTVSYEDFCGVEQFELVTLDVIEFPSTGLPTDTTLCDSGSLFFSNGPWPEGISGLWEDGSSNLTREIQFPGDYNLTLTSLEGCTSTAYMTVESFTLPAYSLGEDVSICPGSSIIFDHEGVLNDINVEWSTSATGSAIEVFDIGSYWVIWEELGCQDSDTVNVAFHPIYDVDWVSDPVVLCEDESQEIEAMDMSWDGGDVDLIWSDGTQGSVFTISAPGFYSVTAMTPQSCSFLSTVNAVSSLNTGVNLGPDLILCDDETVTLNSGYNAAETLWFLNGNPEGLATNSLTFENETTQAVVEVTIGACISQDTIVLDHVPFFDAGLPVVSALCLEDSVFLEALPGAESYSWNNGVDQISQWVNSAGTYTLSTALLGCVFEQYSEVSPSANVGVDLGTDVVLCEDELLDLTSGYSAGETIWWLNDVALEGVNEISVGGEDLSIWVEVVVGSCISGDTLEVDYVPFFDANLPSEVPLCSGDSILLSAAAGAPEYQWNTGELNASLWVSGPGIFSLSTPVQGCMYEASVNVLNVPLPVLNLGPDVDLCEGQQVVLNTQLPLADETFWSNGSTTDTVMIGESGVFSVVVTENGCSSFDAVTVSVQELPVFDLDEDLLICPDEYAFLFVYPLLDGTSVIWSSGQSAPEIEVSDPGMYSATTFLNGCTWTDSVEVFKATPLVVTLPDLFELCDDEVLTVDAANPTSIFPIAYSWSTGETTSSIDLERSGLFEVEVSNVCETLMDSFEIRLIPCGCEAFVPSAFTPDNDGYNDAFKPVMACSPQAYNFEIWNTWGELVFSTSDPNEAWIGQVQGEIVAPINDSYFSPDGIYVWRLKVSFDEGELFDPPLQEYAGTVVVLR